MTPSPKDRALRELLAAQDALCRSTWPTPQQSFALTAARKAIRALGVTPDALLSEHLERSRPLVEAWLMQAGVNAVVRDDVDGLFVESHTPIDSGGGLWARFGRWLGMHGLRVTSHGSMIKRLGVAFECLLQPTAFQVAPMDAHVESKIGMAELTLGRFLIEHALPAPRYEPSSVERSQAFGQRLRWIFGTDGYPSKDDWESWSG